MFLYTDRFYIFMSGFKMSLRKSHERRLLTHSEVNIRVYSNGRISEMTMTKSIFRRVNISPIYLLKHANMMPIFHLSCC